MKLLHFLFLLGLSGKVTFISLEYLTVLDIVQCRGRHKFMKSRIPDPPGSPVVEPRPDPGTLWIHCFWNLARIPVPPGSPFVETSPDPRTRRIPSC